MLEGDNATQETIMLAIEIGVLLLVIGLTWLAVKFKDHPWMVKIGVNRVIDALNFLNTKGKEAVQSKVLEELKTREVRIEFIEKHLTVEQVREFREKVNNITDDKIAELTVQVSEGKPVVLEQLQ